jgi:hypothetical protein
MRANDNCFLFTAIFPTGLCYSTALLCISWSTGKVAVAKEPQRTIRCLFLSCITVQGLEGNSVLWGLIGTFAGGQLCHPQHPSWGPRNGFNHCNNFIFAEINAYQFCLDPNGSNLARWPHLPSRETGKCSLLLGRWWVNIEGGSTTKK